MFPIEIELSTVVIAQKSTAEAARAMRKAAGLSVREVARRMGMSAAFISDLELGRRNWNHRTAKLFTEALKAIRPLG